MFIIVSLGLDREALSMKAVSRADEIRIDSWVERCSRICVWGVMIAVPDSHRTRLAGKDLQSGS